MAEELGEAVLRLRTDDSALDPGMNKAKRGAEALGGTFDKASASSGKLSTSLTTTGRAAATSGTQFQRSGVVVTTSVGQQAMGMRQLSMQLNDVATMYALGARPMQIYTSQIGQVLQAVQLMSGGTNKLANFLGGPWGMAITMATLVLTPLISKLFETDRAMEAVEEGADAMARAQSALGGVFDMVSGKLKTQNELLIINARLMAINLRAEAQTKRASARGALVDAQQLSLGGSMVGRGWQGLRDTNTPAERNAAAARQLLTDIGAGKVSRDDAIQRAEAMDFSGTQTNRKEFQAALRDAVVANLNERAANLIDQSLDSGELAPSLREPGRTTKPKKDTGPSAEDIARRFDDEMTGFTQRSLSAMQQLATTAEERAELEMRGVEWARRQTLAGIAADEDYNAVQKAELAAQVERLAAYERSVVDLRLRRELEQQRTDLAEDAHRSATEALQAQAQLADTEAERKAIALQIFDAEEAFLRSKLEAVRLSDTANEHERARARRAIEALDAGTAARRDGVARANETEVERYLRHLNRTPGQINEAIDGIRIDGLEALNDGLVDAIMGAKSLGEVFHNVAKQIVADLLRIAIQRAVIAPLANMLFGGLGGGGGGGPASLLGGTPFAGFFAAGGLIPAGSFGIVGERGPEPVIGTESGAMVLPNSSLRGGGQAPVVELRVVRGEMFEAEVTQISGNVAVQTVEGYAPALVEASVGETARRFGRGRI